MTLPKKADDMPRQWLVNFPHRSAPAGHLPDHPVFNTWRKYLGEISPDSGDFEDFTEEAFRIHSAIESFGAGNVWTHHQWGEHRGLCFNAVTGEKKVAEVLKHEGAGTYGMQPSPSLSHAVMGAPADDYFTLSSFQRNAGRYVEVGGFNTGDAHDFTQIFSRMYERGIRSAFLKRRNRKYPLIEVDLTAWKGSGSIVQSISDEDNSWALINDEGLPASYLVQEKVKMRYEYRSFIIGGRPVTGAGCVEEHTPLDNHGEVFDDAMREFRNENSAIERLSGVRDALLEFTMRVAAEIAVEAPEIGGYTLDTAVDQNDNPLVIELNGHHNAGFYASQPQRITDALAREIG